MILTCLQKTDLQIDVQKYEFNVEEMIFLRIIMSEQDF
jgi:hypothetical protein